MYGVNEEYVVDIKIDGLEYPVGEGRLARVRMHEWSSVVAPMAELALNDRGNFLVEIMGLTGTEVVQIGIGRGEDDVDNHSFRVFKVVSTKFGSDSHMIKLMLVSVKGAPMLSPARFTSYPNSTVSDAVKAIATDLGMDYEVETTDGSSNLFCPGWTYAQFLAWLADRARSKAHGTAGFLYFVDINNKLHFYSAEYAKAKSPLLNVVRKDLADPESYDEKDVDLGSYRVYQNPMMLGNQAGWGLTSAYFDFEANKFVEAPLTVDGSQGVLQSLGAPGYTSFGRDATVGTTLKGLADSLSMLSSYTDGQNVISHDGVAQSVGEDGLKNNALESRLTRTINSMNKQDLLLQGDLRIRAGGVIDQQIGSPIPENAINQTFSGKWVIEKVTHQLVPQFVTKVTMFRAGISGSDKAGLMSPPGGVVD